MSVLDTVRAFCRGNGIQEPGGLPAALIFERSGQLTVELEAEHVLISLHRTIPLYRDGVALAALKAVSPERQLPLPVRTGFLGEDELVFLTYVAENALDLPMLDRIVTLLAGLAEQIEEGSTA